MVFPVTDGAVLLKLALYAEFHLQYFLKLKKIQQYYDVRFSKFDFSEINAQNIETVNHLIEIMDGKEIRSDIGNGAVQLTYDDINLYKKENMRMYLKRKNLIESTNFPVKEILHGTEINIGFAKLRAEGIEFLNTKQLLNGNKIPVQFKCRELWISYHRKKSN
ncbi:hypothetical protein GCM10027566_08730 [Arachidicoccus ginsenosidivorans]